MSVKMTYTVAGGKECLNFHLRLARDNTELEEAYRIIDEEGFMLTFDKLRLTLQTYQNPMYVAVTEDGQVAATVTLIPTRQGEYSMGNVVVARPFRRKGLGRWMVAQVSQTQADSTVTLVGVQGIDTFYRKIGYTNSGQLHRLDFVQVDIKEVEGKLKSVSGSKDIVVKPYTPEMFEAVRRYDSGQRGYDATRFLQILVQSATVFVAARASTDTDRVVGYAGAFKKQQNVLLDGFYADSDEVALHLFWNILNAFPERAAVKIHSINSRLFLRTLGRRIEGRSSTCTHMTNGPAVLTSVDKLYSVTDVNFTS